MFIHASSSAEQKQFHIRAYVLITGGYTVHVSRTMLALFSETPYSLPMTTESDIDLRPHLTNTCVQTDAHGASMHSQELVKLFWELEGLEAYHLADTNMLDGVGNVDKAWLDQTFAKIGDVIAESVKAGAECGSFGLQLVPNAFEVNPLPWLVSFAHAMQTYSKDIWGRSFALFPWQSCTYLSIIEDSTVPISDIAGVQCIARLSSIG